MHIVYFLLKPRVRWGISWLILLGVAGFTFVQAWTAFNQADRSDGNRGHATIDFGGQWLMGRMIVEGQGRHLYLRNYLRPVAQQAFSTARDSTQKSDADLLMEWLTGTDDPQAPEVLASLLVPLAASNPLDETVVLASAQTTWTEDRLEHVTAPRIGGALYPPIHALYYAPLSLLPPQIAYRVMQFFLLVLVFFIGWVVQHMTEGRVWWPVASLFVLMFPGTVGCITLGQNGLFLLTLALVGWWQVMRRREVLAGLCWGLLAFKPVWAAAFFLVPLLTARGRMAASMVLAGLVQIAVTLPVVGWESWRNWLQVGQEAAQEYKRQENWIVLSRDLLGIPRRWLLRFEGELAKDVVWRTALRETSVSSVVDKDVTENPWDHPLLAVLGWGLWTVVLSGTLFVAWRRRQWCKELTGLFPAFVLSGAVLTCYHFMYYDFVVAGLPVLLLFSEPRRYLQWRFTAFVPPLLLLLMLSLPALGCLRDPSYHFPPWETFVLLLLWMWCGYRLMKKTNRRVTENTEKTHPDNINPDNIKAIMQLLNYDLSFWILFLAAQLAELGANVGSAHECLADQYSVDAGCLQPFDVAACADAAFADQTDIGREIGEKIECVFQACLEGVQVAVVDTDQPRTAVEYARQVGTIVQFHNGLQSQLVCFAQQTGQRGLVENLGDQKDCISPGEACFKQLIAIKEEIFAQERERHGGTDGF